MATCCLETGLDLHQARLLARTGLLSIEDLLDLLEDQDRLRRQDLETIRRQAAEIDRLKQRLEQYEPEVKREPTPGQPPERPSVPYSLAAEEKRRRRRQHHRRKKSPGRRPTEAKWNLIQREEDVIPEGWRLEDCVLVRRRCVWRLEETRAILIGYRIYRAPGASEPDIPGVPRRCEYGIEILVVLAYLVYIIGISLHKACAVLSFFCQLPLSRSQADALLRQLAQHWEAEFDTLCDLLVHACIPMKRAGRLARTDVPCGHLSRSSCGSCALAVTKMAQRWSRCCPPLGFTAFSSATMPPFTIAMHTPRSVGPICCERSFAWRCSTRVGESISAFAMNCCSCITMPSVTRRITASETKDAEVAWPIWKAGWRRCA